MFSFKNIAMIAGVTAGMTLLVNTLASKPGIFKQIFG